MTTDLRAAVRGVPLDDIAGAPTNVKAHDLDLVAASIRRFGFADPVVVDQRTGQLAAGHGRVAALLQMRDAGEDPPEGITGTWEVPVYEGWASSNDDEADAARVALNRTTEAGGWDDVALLDLLDRLAEVEAGLDGVGYTDADMKDLRDRLAQLDGEPEGRGETLELIDVTLPDPTHQPQRGEVWGLGIHRLVVADVVDQWSVWAPYLTGDVLFIPYAGVYAVLAEVAATTPLLLVQPDPYTAGLLVDRWVEATSGEPTRL